MVVDDEPLVCDLLVQFLNLRGYHALGVRNGQDALRLVDEIHPDAILVDMIMPGMAGIDVLRTLREKEYPGGIIIMTGSHNEEMLEEANEKIATLNGSDVENDGPDFKLERNKIGI